MKQSRICKGCKVSQPWSHYFPDSYSAYFRHYCKTCVRKEKQGRDMQLAKQIRSPLSTRPNILVNNR